MFSTDVIETDNFLEMPQTTQNLYIHLSLHADDDGLLGNPKTIARSIGANADDLKLLITKGYLIAFEDGVVAIRDWLVQNTIRKDRHTKTVYQDDVKKIRIAESQQYQLVTPPANVAQPSDNQMTTTCQPSGNQVVTKRQPSDNQQEENAPHKLSKVKLSKDNINNILSGSQKPDPEPEPKKEKIPYEGIIKYLNQKVGTHYQATTPKTRKLIKARFSEGFTAKDFKTVIDKKCAEWLHDGEMVQYLRPDTLFSTKFESYLNQKGVSRQRGKPVRTYTPIASKTTNSAGADMSDEELNSIFESYGQGE